MGPPPVLVRRANVAYLVLENFIAPRHVNLPGFMTAVARVRGWPVCKSTFVFSRGRSGEHAWVACGPIFNVVVLHAQYYGAIIFTHTCIPTHVRCIAAASPESTARY